MVQLRWMMVVLLGLVAGARAEFTPVGANFTGHPLLQLTRGQIEAGNARDAASRIAALLRDHALQVMPIEPQRHQAIWSWCRQMLEEGDDALRSAYRAQVDAQATAAFQAVQARPDHQAEDLAALLLNYPLCTAEPDILAAAMTRAAERADFVTARTYAHLAQEAGWQPDEAAQRLLQAIDRAVSRDSSGPRAWRGLLASETNWYANVDGFLLPRYLPHAAGGRVFLVMAGQVVALEEGGVLRWSWPPGGMTASPSVPALGRGVLYEPAILTDLAGEPRVVIVRQPGLGDGIMVLRALRADDGELLWSSDALPGGEQISFIGSPAVAGTLVYVVAAHPHAQGQLLQLVAVDLLSGQIRWQSPLGVATDPLNAGKGRNSTSASTVFDPQAYFQHSPPAVSGSTVAVGAGGGAIMCFDRFTGALRWSAMYEPEVANSRQWTQYRDRRLRQQRAQLPVKVQQVVRYTNTPLIEAGVLVAAPSDTHQTMGFDLASGRRLWAEETSDAAILIGGGEGLAIYAWQAVAARAVRTGQVQWEYRPPTGSNITGPSVIHGGVVFVPVDQKIITLSLETGRPAPGAAMPSLKRYTTVGPARAALDAAGILTSFESTERAAE